MIFRGGELCLAQNRKIRAIPDIGAAFILSTWKPASGGGAMIALSGSNVTAAAHAGGGSGLAASAGAEPVYDTNELLNGFGSIYTSNGASDLKRLAGGVTGDTPFDLIAIAHITSLGGGAAGVTTWALLGRPAANRNFGPGSNNTNGIAFGNNNNPVSFGADKNRVAIYRVNYDGTTVRTWRDMKAVASAAQTMSIADASISIGGSWFSPPTPGNYPSDPTKVFALLILAGGTLMAAQVASFLRLECQRLRIRRVRGIGDSFMVGADSPASSPLERMTIEGASAGWTFCPDPEGVSTKRTDEVLTILSGLTESSDVCVVIAGANDVVQALPGGHASTGTAADATLIYAKLTEIVQAIHARGEKAVLSTLYDCPGFTAGLRADTVVALNGLVNANAARADGIALIREKQDALGGYDGAHFVDSLHLNDTGNTLITGPALADALIALG